MSASRVRPIAIDLYSGAGGLSLGLEQAGFDVVLAVDKDPYHVATHRRNFPYGKAVCASVADLTGPDLVRELDNNREVDLICGGPPCQGFSSMGKRYVADPRNSHVDHFARLVLEVRPKAFLMENVPGMQAGDTAPIFERVVNALGKHYQLTLPVRPLNAADFGVPQKRERLFLVGIRNDLKRSFEYPETVPASARPTVWDSILDLPRLQRREDLFKNDCSKYPRVNTTRLHPYVRKARGLCVDESDLSHRRIWREDECSGCLRVRHRPDVEELYRATAQGAVVPAHNLPRLDPKGLCPTLRAGTDSEHGSYNAPRPVHPFEARCISVREAARLHGYPDWFKFYPRKWHAHRQIGNSVCAPVAHAIGSAIATCLDVIPRKPNSSLALDDDFTLPSTGVRHHKRIPQIKEWPKVLDALMAQAGVSEAGMVRKPEFRLKDVERAYKSSGASMQRTPAERFLEDIARSRNRRRILSNVLDKGLSILPVSKDGIIGKFVPRGTLGTLEWKNLLTVSSQEVIDAKKVAPLPASTDGSLAAFLLNQVVFDSLFGTGDLTLTPTLPNGNGNRAHIIGRFEVSGRTAHTRTGVVILGVGNDIPGLAAIEALMRRAATTRAVVMSAITKKHFVAVLLSRRNEGLRERSRGVFEISGR